MTADEFLGAIREALVIGPDDTLVLRIGECSSDVFQQLHDVLREHVPPEVMKRILLAGWPVEQLARLDKP
jgi:hypothetical protein